MLSAISVNEIYYKFRGMKYISRYNSDRQHNNIIFLSTFFSESLLMKGLPLHESDSCFYLYLSSHPYYFLFLFCKQMECI